MAALTIMISRGESGEKTYFGWWWWSFADSACGQAPDHTKTWEHVELENNWRTGLRGSWWSCQEVYKRLTIRMKSLLWRSQAKVDPRLERDSIENMNMLPFKDKRVWRNAGDPYQHILLEIRGRRKTKPPVLNHVHSSDFQTRERWRCLIKKKNVLL